MKKEQLIQLLLFFYKHLEMIKKTIETLEADLELQPMEIATLKHAAIKNLDLNYESNKNNK